MRCAVKTCEKLFLITEAPPEPAPEPARMEPPRQQTGSVGDLVPLLPVESDPQPDRGFDLVPILPSEPAAPDWRAAPPPRRTGNQQPTSPAPTTEPTPKKSTAVPK